MLSPGLQQVLFGSSFYPGATVALDMLAAKYRVPGISNYTPDFSSLPGLTVTRATPAVAYGTTPDGVLVPYGPNVARIVPGQGLLVEEARTNLCLQSQGAFSNGAYWTEVVNATSTDNVTAAPDGTLTASKLADSNTTNAQHRIGQSITLAASANSFTVYAKAAEYSWVQIRIGTSGAYFNLAGAGVVGTIDASVTASIEAGANGWYRIRITFTPSAGAQVARINLATGDSSNTYAGVIGNGLYIWGADVELGAFPTSYIPTTSASVTRAADSVSIGSLSVPAPYTVLVSLAGYSDPSGADVVMMNTLVNGAGLYLSGGAPDAPTAFVRESSVTTALVSAGTVAQNTPLKMAGRFAVNDVNVAAQGALGTHDTSSTPPTLTTIGLNGTPFGFGGSKVDNYVRSLIVYPTAYTDAQLRSLTS